MHGTWYFSLRIQYILQINNSLWLCELHRNSKKRNYEQENKRVKLASQLVSANQHPIKPIIENVSLNTSKEIIKNPLMSPGSNNILDPLNEAILDPLSKLVADVSLKEKVSISSQYKFSEYIATIRRFFLRA